MAEGLMRALGGERVEVHSAGLEAHGLNPRAVSAMREIGIDISRQTSDVVDQGVLGRMDYVITLCSHADKHCPMTPSSVNRMHWAFDDPARASGRRRR
jgi:thioredoxin type arsenate reductase